MAKKKGVTMQQLQSSPSPRSEVVVHEKAHNVSAELRQLTEDFGALVVKENAATSSTEKLYKTMNKISTSSHDYSNVFIDEDPEVQQQSYLIGQAVYNQVLFVLPSLIDERLKEYSTTESPSLPIDAIQNDIRKIIREQTTLQNMVNGYQKKIETWTQRIVSIENSQKKIDAVEKRLYEELEELKQVKIQLEDHFKKVRC